MKNKLDREFTLGGLLRFTLPTVVMMIFTSLYTIVDGVFVSRLVGANALSALNIAYPALCVVLAVGIMLATGGSAVVARRMGEGEEQAARESFTFLTVAAVVAGLAFAVLGAVAAAPLSRLLGASDLLLQDCIDYMRILLLFAPFFMLQLMFQSFFVAAGRPGLGLGLTVVAGFLNAGLDYLFMGPLGLGVTGAALATAAGYLVPAAVGVAFFLLRRHGLRFARFRPDWRLLGKSCFNGSSEMVTNLAGAVVTFLFNAMMMRYLGEAGVAAITIVLYAQFLLTALYMGFSMGVAPIISFHHGAANTDRLHRVFRHCLLFILCASVVTFVLALGLTRWVVGIFSPAGTEVYAIALDGFRKFSPTFLFAGVNIFASAFFTAFNDGRTSAIISFARTFGFLLVGLLVLPIPLGVTGVWLAVPFAEVLCSGLSVLYLWRKRRVFQYA